MKANVSPWNLLARFGESDWEPIPTELRPEEEKIPEFYRGKARRWRLAPAGFGFFLTIEPGNSTRYKIGMVRVEPTQVCVFRITEVPERGWSFLWPIGYSISAEELSEITKMGLGDTLFLAPVLTGMLRDSRWT